MTDSTIADIGRRLAEKLQDVAYTRKDDDRKAVSQLHYELVLAVRAETVAQQAAE